MASSVNQNEQQQEEQILNSSDPLPYHVKFSDHQRNFPQRKNSIITPDDSSLASRQGL